MLHYNDIKEGQTVKYFGHHTCEVQEKRQANGVYYVELSYPNQLMITVTCQEQSRDGYFKNISL